MLESLFDIVPYLQACNLLKRNFDTGGSWKYFKIFENTFSAEHLQATVSKLTSSVKYIVVFRTLSNMIELLCKSNYLRKKALTQQTFWRYFKVVFWSTWHRDVRQLQINVETTLPISTLEFATSNQRCVFQRWYEQSIKSIKRNIVRIKHYAEKNKKKQHDKQRCWISWKC